MLNYRSGGARTQKLEQHLELQAQLTIPLVAKAASPFRKKSSLNCDKTAYGKLRQL